MIMFHESIALGIIALSWDDSCYLLPLKGSCASIVLARLIGIKGNIFWHNRDIAFE